MMASKVPPGHVRAVVERPHDRALVAAANDLLSGGDPTRFHAAICHGGTRGKFQESSRSIRRSEQFRSGAAKRKCRRLASVSGAREIGKIPCERFC